AGHVAAGASEAFRVAPFDGFGATGGDNRNRAGQLHQDRNNAGALGHDHVRIKFDKVRGCGANEVHVVAGPAFVELRVDAGGPSAFSQLLAKGAHARLRFRVCRRERHQYADPAHACVLLRTRRERPRGRRGAEQGDELAPPHSITSLARASKLSGTVRPSALAVLRLITSSYLVGACTGRSDGFSPLKMRSM